MDEYRRIVNDIGSERCTGLRNRERGRKAYKRQTDMVKGVYEKTGEENIKVKVKTFSINESADGVKVKRKEWKKGNGC